MGQLQRSAFSGSSLAPCLPRSWTRSRYHLPPSDRLGEPWGRLKGHRVAGAVIKAQNIRTRLSIKGYTPTIARALACLPPVVPENPNLLQSLTFSSVPLTL